MFWACFNALSAWYSYLFPLFLKAPALIFPIILYLPTVFVEQPSKKANSWGFIQVLFLWGDVINYFSSKQSFLESDNGDEHIVENIGNKPAVLYVVAASAVGLPITIHD